MLVLSRAHHVSNGRPGTPSYGAEDTVLTPKGSDEPAILSDSLTTTYASNARPGALAAFALTREDAGDRLFLANRIYVYGYNFMFSAGNVSQTGKVTELFNASSKAQASASFLSLISKTRYNYAKMRSCYAAEQARAYEIYSLVAMVDKPTITPSLNRNGAHYDARLTVSYDNTENFASYDAQANVYVFHPDVYNTPGFDVDGNIPFAEFKAGAHTLVDGPKTIDVSCSNTSRLEEGITYRMYYRVELSGLGTDDAGTELGTYSNGWQYLDFTTLILPKPPIPTLVKTGGSVYSAQMTAAVDSSLVDPTLTLTTLTIERSNDGNAFESIASFDISSVREVSFIDSSINLGVTTSYRAIVNAVDVNGDTFISSPSALAEYKAITEPLIATKTAQVLNAMFIEGCEFGTYEDDNVSLWPQGSNTPQIMLGVKHKQKGTIVIRLKEEEIEQGTKIITDNSAVKMIDPDGKYHLCILSDTKNVLRNVLERRSDLTATFQDIE